MGLDSLRKILEALNLKLVVPWCPYPASVRLLWAPHRDIFGSG